MNAFSRHSTVKSKVIIQVKYWGNNWNHHMLAEMSEQISVRSGRDHHGSHDYELTSQGTKKGILKYIIDLHGKSTLKYNPWPNKCLAWNMYNFLWFLNALNSFDHSMLFFYWCPSNVCIHAPVNICVPLTSCLRHFLTGYDHSQWGHLHMKIALIGWCSGIFGNSYLVEIELFNWIYLKWSYFN